MRVPHFVLGMVLASTAGVAMSAAQGIDLGTRGPVYPIGEPNMLDEIKSVLKAKEASGELARLQEEAVRRARERITTPAPVAGLAKVAMSRKRLYDPSVRFDEAIVDHQGKTVVAPGTVVNPLDHVTLNKVLMFFDGRDPAQVQWAKTFAAREKLEVTPILVAGSPVRLMDEWGRRVFFDQGGELVRKFGIRAVPTTVRQQGDRLELEELTP